MHRILAYSACLAALSLSCDSVVAQNHASTSTSIVATPVDGTVGTTIDLTATVQPSASSGNSWRKPSGTVTFFDGSTSLGASPVPLTSNIFTSASFQETFGTPDPVFTGSSTFTPTGATGDLNGDGVADLLLYQATNTNSYALQAFVSKSQGGYAAGGLQTFSFQGSTYQPLAMTILPSLLDVNGDGRVDLLWGTQVAYGNGDGSFAAPVSPSFLSGYVASYAVDLNGDGKQDILAVNASPAWPNLQYAVTALLNQGGGSFSVSGTYTVGTGGMGAIYAFQPGFVDLNGDGKLDLVLQWNFAQMGAPVVSVLLNSGNGTFGSATQLTVPTPPNLIVATCLDYQIGSGDLNGDGKQDLLLGTCDYSGDSDVITFLGNGDGTFQSPTTFVLPTPPNVVVNIIPNFIVEDVNGDGHLDLTFGSGRLALGKGDGTFTSGPPLFPLPTSPSYSAPVVQMQLTTGSVPSIVYALLRGTPSPQAVFTPQTSSTASLSLAQLGAGTHSITANYSGDATYGSQSSSPVNVVISAASSSTAVTSSANPSYAGQSVTFTAQVVGGGPTPTGNVVFSSGSTTLGTAPLSGGSATYTTTALSSVGTQTITAAYSGDANTQASSGMTSQVIQAAFEPGPSSTGTATLTVKAGQAVTAPINVSGASGFTGRVTLSCSGLPAGAGCSFSPASLSLSGTVPATSTLTVNTATATASTSARNDSQTDNRRIAYGLTFGSFLLVGTLRRRSWAARGFLGCILLLFTLGLMSCGRNNTSAATSPGSYHFQVTATSGSMTASTVYTLTVE